MSTAAYLGDELHDVPEVSTVEIIYFIHFPRHYGEILKIVSEGLKLLQKYIYNPLRREWFERFVSITLSEIKLRRPVKLLIKNFTVQRIQ